MPCCHPLCANQVIDHLFVPPTCRRSTRARLRHRLIDTLSRPGPLNQQDRDMLHSTRRDHSACPLVTLPPLCPLSLSHLCCTKCCRTQRSMRPALEEASLPEWTTSPPHRLHSLAHSSHTQNAAHRRGPHRCHLQCDQCGGARCRRPVSIGASGRTHLERRSGVPERSVVGVPLKSCHNTAKVMLIAIVLCLTVSSCQTLYSVIESPPSKTRSEWRSVALASDGETHRVQQITYINQRAASVPGARYDHANRLKGRPTRSDKTPDRPLRPKPVEFVPSLLSTSLLTAPLKPPYASGSPILPSPLASANRMETPSTPRNITAQVGHPAYLHCVVESLGDKMVSWIRLRDFHLLTIGSLTYIQEDRFAVRHTGHSPNDWSLQIKHVTVKDEGLYECQINSDPPRSQYYYLHIVVPVSEITGNPDIFVRLGAPINLTCVISSSPEPPAFVFWYHNNRMINYDYSSDSKGQISVQKDPSRNDVVVSHLLIRKARLDDSGNYTCSPSNAEPASSYVHVLQGEKRMSNQIQNDWSQTDPLSNEAHHSSFLLPTWTLNVQLAALLFSSAVCLRPHL